MVSISFPLKIEWSLSHFLTRLNGLYFLSSQDWMVSFSFPHENEWSLFPFLTRLNGLYCLLHKIDWSLFPFITRFNGLYFPSSQDWMVSISFPKRLNGLYFLSSQDCIVSISFPCTIEWPSVYQNNKCGCSYYDLNHLCWKCKKYEKWPRGYKTFSFSTHLSMKFTMLINVKIASILTFMSMINFNWHEKYNI